MYNFNIVLAATPSKLDIFGNMANHFLANFINGFLTNVTDASFYIPDKIFTMNGVLDKYNAAMKSSKTFIILSLTTCVVGLLYSLDIFATAKLRKILNEFVFALFFITFGSYFINQFNALSNLFVKLFLPTSGTGYANAIFVSIGVASATGVLETVGFFLLILVGAIAVILMLMMLTHSILIGLLEVSIIIFPILMAVYPLSFGKSLVKSLVSMYGGLLALGPLQAIVLNILTSSLGQASTPSFTNIMNALGMLVLTSLVIPGVIIFVIVRATNPKIN